MASGIHKSPNFNTVRQKGAAGVNAAIALKPYPTWDFEWSMDHVTGHEHTAASVVAQFLGMFMATAGGAGLWLFTDPQDNTVTSAQFGTGTGSATKFQLSRNICGYPDIVQNLCNGCGHVHDGPSQRCSAHLVGELYVCGSLLRGHSRCSSGVHHQQRTRPLDIFGH
jgi:hypothetical protein